ncbi:Unknown protein, partial [Striga hermonthica]
PIVSRGHPFAEDVLGGDLPSNFSELSLSYDGSADPARHLRSFDNIAVLHRYSDVVSCRAFLKTLKGSAQDWFHQLPVGSIDSFEKFSSLFPNQFASARKHEKTYLTLINMQQKEGETLRQYIARYTKECVEVPSASEENKAGGLTRGLRPGKYIDSLAKRPARSFDELLERCSKYVNMEELEADFTRNDKTKAKQVEERPRQDDRRATPKESRVEERSKGPRYEHYKPLSAPQQEILETMEKRGEDKLLAQPKPLPPPRKFSASKDRYCRYHREYVHSTNFCRELKDEIERLIRVGNLKEFVIKDRERQDDRREGRESGDKRRRTDEQLDRTVNKGIIHMIVGGPKDGDSHRERKRTYRGKGVANEVAVVQV